jgi:hypothetical protein
MTSVFSNLVRVHQLCAFKGMFVTFAAADMGLEYCCREWAQLKSAPNVLKASTCTVALGCCAVSCTVWFACSALAS